MLQQVQRWGMERGCPLSPSEFLGVGKQYFQQPCNVDRKGTANLQHWSLTKLLISMKLFAVCMSCALLHWMQHDAAYSTSRTWLENTPVMAVRVCTCSHGQRTKYKQMQRASHNAAAKQLSDSNPCEHCGKTWTCRACYLYLTNWNDREN